MEQKGGGSYLQPMGGYLDGPAPIPASAGTNLLTQTNDLFARPRIENTAFPPGGMLPAGMQKGGFFPSIYGGVVDAGAITLPAAAVMARRMFSASKRRGGGRKGNTWAAQRAEARRLLEQYGVPNGTNISAFASRYFEGRKKYDPAAAREWLREFQVKVARGERKRQRNRPSRARVTPRPAAEPTRRSGRTIVAPNRLTYPANYISGTRRAPRAATPRSNTPPRVRTRRAPTQTATRRQWFNQIRNAHATLKQRGIKANAVMATRLAKHRREGEPNERFLAAYMQPQATIVPPPRVDPRTLLPVPRPAAVAVAPLRPFVPAVPSAPPAALLRRPAASVVTRTGRLKGPNAEERRLIAKRALQRLGIQPSAVNIQQYVKALKEGASPEEIDAIERALLYRKSQTKRGQREAATRAAAAVGRPGVRFANAFPSAAAALSSSAAYNPFNE